MIVDVAVPVPLYRSFHYEVDETLGSTLQAGSLIEVPFRQKKTIGFVLGFPESSDVKKVKMVERVLIEEPVFDGKMMKFLSWMSEYYCYPLGEVMGAALPRDYWVQRKKRKKNEVEFELESLSSLGAFPNTLTELQGEVLSVVNGGNWGETFLLHGITGSGKTEVYIRALDEVVRAGRGGIVLVPEISLTPQLLARFASRFPGMIAVLHSNLKPRERSEQWRKVFEGKARIVIGARSAIFAPVKDLGLIVVDEEHEGSFKQDDNLRYNARDMAVVRGKMEGAKVVLGSATPSLESLWNAKQGRYRLLEMKERVEKRPLPTPVFVDLKQNENLYSEEFPFLSKELVRRIEKALLDGEQVLLYLNRLGFAHFLYCKDCGHTFRCNNCDVSLTYYQTPPALKCHYCGMKIKAPSQCESCGGLNVSSMGVGTEQVEQAIRQLFPDRKIGRMDRSVVKTRQDLEDVLVAIAERKLEIVIGTQMIAKGHDFPGVSLVGVLVADANLNLPDFRANEKTFQIITQMAGRAGRGAVEGTVVIQTMNPEHPVLMAAAHGDSGGFYERELEYRKETGFPPYRRLVMLKFQHRNPERVRDFALWLVREIRKWDCVGKSIEVIGPSEAPLSKVKNVYRWHCLLKSGSIVDLQSTLRRILQIIDLNKNPVRLLIDIDPQNLF